MHSFTLSILSFKINLPNPNFLLCNFICTIKGNKIRENWSSRCKFPLQFHLLDDQKKNIPNLIVLKLISKRDAQPRIEYFSTLSRVRATGIYVHAGWQLSTAQIPIDPYIENPDVKRGSALSPVLAHRHSRITLTNGNLLPSWLPTFASQYRQPLYRLTGDTCPNFRLFPSDLSYFQ